MNLTERIRRKLYARFFQDLVNGAIDIRIGQFQDQLDFAVAQMSNCASQDRQMLAEMISKNLVRLKETILWGPELWRSEPDHNHPPAGHRAIFPEFEFLFAKLNQLRIEHHQKDREFIEALLRLDKRLDQLERQQQPSLDPGAHLGARE